MANAPHSTDILRKSSILVLLVVAMWLLHRFAVPGELFDPRALMALGFIILAAFTVGELVEVIGLPHITGYLLVGMLLGHSVASILSGTQLSLPPPFDHGILTEGIVEQLGLLDALALALIALTAGGELRLEALKKGFGTVLGLLGGQVVMIGVLVTGLVWLFSGPIPFLSLPTLAAIDSPTAVLALGGVIAAISLATSPAATIAVINGNRAEGPMTQQVLSVVVLKDVVVVIAFSAVTVLATGLLGVAADTTFLDSIGHIVSSMLVGVILGGLVHLYLRYIDMERLLFLVSVIYTATFVVNSFHGEPALTFIVAGFVVANFSPHGERLIHEVERLALPVYVVFFTLAGAKLHLDVLSSMASFAILLVGVRIVAIWLGTKFGARWTGADVATEQHGWMGFVSQAGLAITLADAVRKTYPDGVGDELFSLVLGAVAINEMVGPVLFQSGIRLAGENDPSQNSEDEFSGQSASPEMDARHARDDAWGDRRPLGHDEIDSSIEMLERATRAQMQSLEDGPLCAHGQELSLYVRSLRREYLRFHRDLRKALTDVEEPDDRGSLTRARLGALGDRWCDVALDRATITGRPGRWSLGDLVAPLDRLSVGLPLYVRTTVPTDCLTARKEKRRYALRRTLRRNLHAIGFRQRTIPLRDLVRYHLSGKVPERLEGVAAVLLRSDLQLANQTHRVFLELVQMYQPAEGGEGTQPLTLDVIKSLADTLFRELSEDVERLQQDVLSRGRYVLGHGIKAIEEDCWTIGTPDLGARARRYSRVFRTRTEALKRLDEGVEQAWKTVSARYGALALDLELSGIEGEISCVVNAHAAKLARQINQRGPTQLERIVQELKDGIEGMEKTLSNPDSSGPEVLRGLEEHFTQIPNKIGDVSRGIDALLQDLATEAHAKPLILELHRLAHTLTEWHHIPDQSVEEGEWRIPSAVGVTDVPLRALTLGLMEGHVRKQLLAVSTELEQKVHQMRSGLDDFERVLSFNLELAQGELETQSDLTPATRGALHEMMVGAVGRALTRLETLMESARPWPDEAHEAVCLAVMQEFSTLHATVHQGGNDAMGRKLLGQNFQVARWLSWRDASWALSLQEWRNGLLKFLRSWIDESTLAAFREEWGFLDPNTQPQWQNIQHGTPSEDLPTVYARLFSNMVFETGDLPETRQRELEQLCAGLEARHRLRTATIISDDQVSSESLVAALARRKGTQKFRRCSPRAPMSKEGIDEWFDEAPLNHLTIVDGLEWLFRLQPGGFEPLRHLLLRLVQEKGRGAWVFTAHPLVWASATSIGDFDSAITTPLRLQPLEPHELGDVLLARHHMSGFQLDVPHGAPWRHILTRFEADPGAARAAHEAAWIRGLHKVAGGNLTSALGLWLSSIERIDTENHVLTVGTVPPYPLSSLAGLPEVDWLVLSTALRQGWIDPPLTSRALAMHRQTAAGHLVRLETAGLLTHHADRDYWMVPPHLSGVLMQCFSERRWS